MGVECGIQAVLGNQGVVVAILHDLTFLDDEDAVGAAYRGKAMGDNDAGTTLKKAFEGFLY